MATTDTNVTLIPSEKYLNEHALTPSWSMQCGKHRNPDKVIRMFQKCMHPDFKTEDTMPNIEEKLSQIKSGPFTHDNDPLWNNMLVLMPAPFEVYCLETDRELRDLWKGSMHKWPHMTPNIVKMVEYNFRGQEKHLLWIGLMPPHGDGDVPEIT